MLRVLITDDSRVMRQIVVRTLRQAGYDWDVREAADGQEAFDAVLADEPDLVLSDWNMPEMNGIDALRVLRSAGNEIPFGFVTSEGSEAMRERAAQAGAAFLIAKPFTPEAFDDALASVGVRP